MRHRPAGSATLCSCHPAPAVPPEKLRHRCSTAPVSHRSANGSPKPTRHSPPLRTTTMFSPPAESTFQPLDELSPLQDSHGTTRSGAGAELGAGWMAAAARDISTLTETSISRAASRLRLIKTFVSEKDTRSAKSAKEERLGGSVDLRPARSPAPLGASTGCRAYFPIKTSHIEQAAARAQGASGPRARSRSFPHPQDLTPKATCMHCTSQPTPAPYGTVQVGAAGGAAGERRFQELGHRRCVVRFVRS